MGFGSMGHASVSATKAKLTAACSIETSGDAVVRVARGRCRTTCTIRVPGVVLRHTYVHSCCRSRICTSKQLNQMSARLSQVEQYRLPTQHTREATVHLKGRAWSITHLKHSCDAELVGVEIISSAFTEHVIQHNVYPVHKGLLCMWSHKLARAFLQPYQFQANSQHHPACASWWMMTSRPSRTCSC